MRLWQRIYLDNVYSAQMLMRRRLLEEQRIQRRTMLGALLGRTRIVPKIYTNPSSNSDTDRTSSEGTSFLPLASPSRSQRSRASWARAWAHGSRASTVNRKELVRKYVTKDVVEEVSRGVSSATNAILNLLEGPASAIREAARSESTIYEIPTRTTATYVVTPSGDVVLSPPRIEAPNPTVSRIGLSFTAGFIDAALGMLVPPYGAYQLFQTGYAIGRAIKDSRFREQLLRELSRPETWAEIVGALVGGAIAGKMLSVNMRSTKSYVLEPRTFKSIKASRQLVDLGMEGTVAICRYRYVEEGRAIPLDEAVPEHVLGRVTVSKIEGKLIKVGWSREGEKMLIRTVEPRGAKPTDILAEKVPGTIEIVGRPTSNDVTYFEVYRTPDLIEARVLRNIRVRGGRYRANVSSTVFKRLSSGGLLAREELVAPPRMVVVSTEPSWLPFLGAGIGAVPRFSAKNVQGRVLQRGSARSTNSVSASAGSSTSTRFNAFTHGTRRFGGAKIRIVLRSEGKELGSTGFEALDRGRHGSSKREDVAAETSEDVFNRLFNGFRLRMSTSARARIRARARRKQVLSVADMGAGIRLPRLKLKVGTGSGGGKAKTRARKRRLIYWEEVYPVSNPARYIFGTRW